MPPVGFEPTISAGERPKTYALDLVATGTGTTSIKYKNYEQASVSPWFNVMTRRLAEAQKFTNRILELCNKKYDS